ncbi:MAG: hypothetical protein K2O45_15955 [Oscillospiraceae bacterium]|nr:hypothetical protein [Oscillospiraceae bacterium]
MKSHYKQAMDALVLSPEAETHILTCLRRPKHRIRFRPAAIAAAVLLLALGATAAAGGVALHELPAAIIQSLQPVRLSDTDQGISMTVQSAAVEDGVFTAYITMTDERDGDRLAQGVSLYDSYRIGTPYGAGMMSFGCQPLGYDEFSKSYGYLVTIRAKDNAGQTIDFPKRKFTFSVRQLMLGQDRTKPELSLDWDTLPARPRTQQKYCFGGSYIEGYEPAQQSFGSMVDFLQPGTMDVPVADGVAITAGGFLDGKLHLLLRYDNTGPDDHGWLQLISPKDGRADVAACVSMAYREEDGTKYEELIYDITPEDLEGRVLAGEFTTGGYLLNGDWKVTFTIQDGE